MKITNNKINTKLDSIIKDEARKKAKIIENRFKSKNQKRLMNACIDFEAIFIKMMLNSMKKNIPKAGFIDGGFAEEVFDDMLYTEYSKIMAKQGGFGLARMIYNQLKGAVK